MRLFLSLSLISVAAAACGDDGGSCGAGGITQEDMTASNDSFKVVYGSFTSGQNNDCPDSAAPAGVVSLTVAGTQSDGHGSGLLTFCIPRPDLLTTTSAALNESASGAGVHLVDLTGTDAAGCTYTIDTTKPAAGTVQSSGLCKDGADSSGYGLLVNGNLSVLQTCNGGSPTSIAIMLNGAVSVSAQ